MTDRPAPLRILLVEDSADDAELMQQALLDAGLSIEMRIVQEDAGMRAELAGFLPEVPIIDWNLPGFSAAGAWAWYSTDDPTGDEWAGRTVRAGLRASAYGPIEFGDQLVGAVVIGTYSQAFAKTLVEKMAAIVSFSSTSSGLFALRMQEMRREAWLRRSLEAVIGARAFHPVFQPIVDLESWEVLGHEALTRFNSGQRPDLCFADAHSVGLGGRLESQTLEAALAAAQALPSGMWLSLNVSPYLLVESPSLSAILQPPTDPW